MDMLKGAQILRDLIEERGGSPPARGEVDETAPTFYRWVGVTPSARDAEDAEQGSRRRIRWRRSRIR